MRLLQRVATLLATGSLTVGLLAAVASAEDPPFVPWTQLLPGLTDEYDPSSANLCTSGHPRCIDAVIREMERRFKPLARTCDHDAVFALTYLRTTEEFRRASNTPGFFTDPRFLNHQAAVFAKYYFDAYDAWHAGRRSSVPHAWRIAFAAADGREVTGAGNLLLGMSGHVNRDLPFVLAAIGMTKPDGSSRKRDHDKVNEFLNRVTGPLLAEIARRFDPTVDDANVEATKLDEGTLLQLVVTWREEAWRNGEQLVAAPGPSQRALVADKVERDSAVKQETIKGSSSYRPPSSSAARDAWCAEHWDDP